MFWKRKDNDSKATKLSGPKDVPEIIKKQITPDMIDPATIPFLKILTKGSEKGDKVLDFRLYDPSDAEARALKIVNYTSLDGINDMIIGEGSYDEAAKSAAINIKKKLPKYKLLNYDEILKGIESLAQDKSSVYFYASAGVGAGGPLGRGAIIVKLNPTNGEKKRKKYGVYGSNVINMLPDAQKEVPIFDSDKSKDIAKWVVDAHKPRFC